MQPGRRGLRLTVNLVNATSGCYECCESLEVESIDTFAVQDGIAERWSRRLQPHF